MNHRPFIFALSLALFSALLIPGCANQNPDEYERDDYFGGHGNLIRPKHYVPREVRR